MSHMKKTGYKLISGVTAIAVLSMCGAFTAFAEETTTDVTTTTTTTTETTDTTTATVTTTTAEQVTEPEAAETEETEESINWLKTDFSEYDSSLSLTSYKTSPEAQSEKEKQRDSMKNSGEPFPVPLQTSGGVVSEIPYVVNEPEIEARPGEFAIVTYGWGHGVGMSQNGANFYAGYSGWTYQDILFHYYPETYLMNTNTAEDEEITIGGVSGDVLTQVSKVVYNEVGGSMNYEAIKAQAVAVYTYCKYNGNDGNDLMGKANPPQIVIDACEEVLGEALYYNDDFALTMFSASTGGVTANCYEIFWADMPYLRSVSSDYDAYLDPHYGTVTYFSDTYIKNMIERTYGLKLSNDPAKWIQPIYSEETGYVTQVNIDNQMTVKGYDFKLAMGLKSPKFNVYYTYDPDSGYAPEEEPEEVVTEEEPETETEQETVPETPTEAPVQTQPPVVQQPQQDVIIPLPVNPSAETYTDYGYSETYTDYGNSGDTYTDYGYSDQNYGYDYSQDYGYTDYGYYGY